MTAVALEPIAASAPSIGTAPLLELTDLAKQFGEVVAVDQVSLTLSVGEILGLLGENGAGKSTLLNMLAGMLPPDAGVITIDGRTVQIGSPKAALGYGIGTVYQHFTLIPNLSVIENLVLGRGGGMGLGLRREMERLRPTLDLLDLTMPLRTPVRSLAMGERQRLEIAKVLARGATILLLDEPTSILTPQEVERLFTILRRIQATGVGTVLVTHKLDEALAICDRIAVVRSGSVRGELNGAEIACRDSARRRIVELMFDRERSISDARPVLTSRSIAPMEKPRLSLRAISVRDDRGQIAVRDLSLDLRSGEIVGIAGVDGNGQRELAEALAGQRGIASGSIRLDDREVSRSGAHERRNAGIAYVTDDRQGEGAVLGLGIAENLALKSIDEPPFSRFGLIDRRAVRRHADKLMARFEIRAPGPSTLAGRLSGGNLQKVLLARELAAGAHVIICKEPTQGLDARTGRQVLDALRTHVSAGECVLMISSDLNELLAACDRIAVMYRGRLVGMAPRTEVNAVSLGALMLGGSPPTVEPHLGSPV